MFHPIRTALCLALSALPSLSQSHPEWTAALPPFRMAGNLYYVGSQDLAAYLWVTPQGNILLNSNLASSPAQIRASVEALGFRWAETRILLISQAHYDHAAGAAQIVRETGARLEVMEGDAAVMESGDKDDFGGPELTPFAPVPVSRVLHDGDTVALGGTVLTAHRTAGHTRGTTTFTFTEPVVGVKTPGCVVGGWTALDSYRLAAKPGAPESYPGITQDFRHTFAAMKTLPCDLFLGAHGVYFDMLAKRKRMTTEGERVWLDPEGYRKALAGAQAAFEKKLAAQP